jgi:hypothetical protein
VSGEDRELLEQLGETGRRMATASARLIAYQNSGELSVPELRELGYGLVAVAGELTTLGVTMARHAQDLTGGS